MDQLFAHCDTTGIFQHSANLVAGDDVKITQGQFADAIAEIIEVDPNQRIHLLLSFMGQTSTLMIAATGIAPTS